MKVFAGAPEHRRLLRALNERLAFETLLSDLSATFINLPSAEIDAQIECWLARIGEVLGIDRSRVVQFSPGGTCLVVSHSWMTPGFGNDPAQLTGQALEWVVERLRRGEIVACSRLEDIPEEVEGAREYCLRHGIQSIVVIPLAVGGRTLGAVAFSCVRRQRTWSAQLVQRLRLVGEIFANAMVRKRAEEALLREHGLLSQIMETSPEGIILMNREGRIVFANPCTERILGLARHEITRRRYNAQDWRITDYDGNPFPDDALPFSRVMRSGAPVQDIHHAIELSDGRRIFLSVNAAPVLAESGGMEGVVACIRDITERKRAEAQAQQHVAELTRAWHINTLGEMASGLAHELSQPLCAIMSYSNACLRLSQEDRLEIDSLRSSIAEIAGQAERAAEIVKRIKGLIAKRQPQCEALDLNAVLRNVLQMLSNEALAHHVTVVTHFARDLPRMRGDRVEIEQVVLNLARNAIEAMSDADGGRRILTVSSALSNGELVEVAMTDTGRGLAPGLSEKIFESFFTTKPSGLGIGLSLSRRIVEARGGRLWAESDGLSGATFRFTLSIESPTR